jgi:large subunit ribosomal protein L23
MSLYDLILRPVQSEKSTNLRERENKYTFLVAMHATKPELKLSIEKMYDVKVKAVNTSIVPGKSKRRGQHLYKRNNRKKAIVTLSEGHKIKLFDDQ